MENLLCIKGKIIGKGKPLVCVPVMESSKEEILRETRRLEEAHTEMIEWRVDAFENVESPNAIREILNEMKHIIKESILVYTFRSKNQGGCKALSAADIYDIHQVAAESDVVDFIDVEYFEAKNPQKEIAMLREMGAYVIASHHDFEQTPDPEVIRMLLEQIRESGADVVKLAVMPQNMWDVLHLLEETNRFHENHPDHPLITMSMGAKGGISRVAGEFFGSCVTFGAGGHASAPGQLPVKQLEEILHILHQSVD
jgi:3-dehydroquinate dehydratase-1